MQLTDIAKMASSLLQRRKVACGRFRSKLGLRNGRERRLGCSAYKRQTRQMRDPHRDFRVARSADASRHVFLEVPLSGSPRAVVQNMALA
jgi:hypothetical protein